MFCKNCGKEIDDKASICINCGVSTHSINSTNDNGGFGWNILGCCIPIVGLTLYLVWKDTKPKSAKATGIGALIYFKEKQFPICARCSGELLGILLSIFLYKFYKLNILFSFIFILPLLVDGFYQLLTKYESTNIKRLITGILFGYGFFNLFLKSIFFTILIGQHYAKLNM